MLFRWISLLGVRYDQPKARRPKETVKPRLEELLARILPSATPSPGPGEEAMQMVATRMEQQVQRIVTLEQGLVNLFDTYTQRIAQIVASDVQQWKQFLGIAPPSGSGSGSGSGTITTTNNAANQQPIAIQPKSGSGTGSGATTSHENSTKQRITPLVADGSAGSNDELEWDPTDPTDPTNSGLPDNWYDMTQGQQGVMLPSQTNPVLFDGSIDKPINWKTGGNVASVTVQNGYDAQMTIGAGWTLTDNGILTANNKSTLNVSFSNASTFNIKGGGTITNMKLANGAAPNGTIGTLQLSGGTMTIDPNPGGYTENLGVNLTVVAGAILKYMNYDTLQLTSNNIVITVSGEMDTYYGTNDQNTMIGGGAANPNDYINVSDGTLVYYGRQNRADTITVPIEITGGTLKVTVNSEEKPLQGKLIVQGKISPNNVSVYMTGPSGNVTLDSGDTLECDNGYYQVDGTLKTLDNTNCTLELAPVFAGTATVSGGKVSINTAANSVGGQLTVDGDLNFADAQLQVKVQGYAPNGNAGTSSTLVVTTTLSIDPDLLTGA